MMTGRLDCRLEAEVYIGGLKSAFRTEAIGTALTAQTIHWNLNSHSA